MDLNLQIFEAQLVTWFTRKTLNSAVRKIGEWPISVGTDIGSLRNENQDRVAVMKLYSQYHGNMQVVVLCDGMGGMSKGSLCAATAISAFLKRCIEYRNTSFPSLLREAAFYANTAVFNAMRGAGGSTLSAIALSDLGGEAAINIGDSRIYGYANGALKQLTRDDTLEGQFSRLSGDDLRGNELLQFVGMGAGIEPHEIYIKDEGYDNFLLTSDGAHYLEKKMLEMLIRNASDMGTAVKRITEVAKWCSGHDNASTAILAPLYSNSSLPFGHEANIVQIWDAFGEVQFILPEGAGYFSSEIKRYSEETVFDKIEKKFVNILKQIDAPKSVQINHTLPKQVQDTFEVHIGSFLPNKIEDDLRGSKNKKTEQEEFSIGGFLQSKESKPTKKNTKTKKNKNQVTKKNKLDERLFLNIKVSDDEKGTRK